MALVTVLDLDEAWYDLRVWCFACARGGEVHSGIWRQFEERGWSIDLVEARRRFRCNGCGSSADVVLLPTRRPPAPEVRVRTWAQEVEAFFFANRKGKRLFEHPGTKRR